MGVQGRILLITLGLSLPLCQVYAGQPVTIGIVEFVGKGGVAQEQVDGMADELAKEIGRQGKYRVVGQADVLSMLDLENQKCLTDCTDECCFAWIGNAMGARWTITGNISRFGSVHVLSLKLIDVMSAKVTGRVTRKAKGAAKSLQDQLKPAVEELLSELSDTPVETTVTRPKCSKVCKENDVPHCIDLACVLRQAAAANQECTLAPARTIMQLNPDDLNLVLWKHNPRSFEVR